MHEAGYIILEALCAKKYCKVASHGTLDDTSKNKINLSEASLELGY